jgi:hypothetical protein
MAFPQSTNQLEKLFSRKASDLLFDLFQNRHHLALASLASYLQRDFNGAAPREARKFVVLVYAQKTQLMLQWGHRVDLTNKAATLMMSRDYAEYQSHKVLETVPFRCNNPTQYMSPLNRQLFGKPEDDGSSSSTTLLIENIPPAAVPPILDALQNHDINRSLVVHIRCSTQAWPPPNS